MLAGAPRACQPHALQWEQFLSAPYELEVRYRRRGDRPHEIDTVKVVADTIEQPLTAAEERRHDVDLHLVHETGREILLCGPRPPGERYIRTCGGSPGLFERSLDTSGDEREGRSAFQFEWLRARAARDGAETVAGVSLARRGIRRASRQPSTHRGELGPAPAAPGGLRLPDSHHETGTHASGQLPTVG
jgi:hypothetical protein